jgi:hypothetical protein
MTLPILTYDEAQIVGEAVHDHWVRMRGETPIARDNLGWADLVQFVTRKACEQVVERAGDDAEH